MADDELQRALQRIHDLEAERDEAVRRFDTLISRLPALIWEVRGAPDADRQEVTLASPFATALLGYTPAELLADPALWPALVVAEDRAAWQEAAQKVYEGGAPRLIQVRWTRKDGRVIWIDAYVATRTDEAGAIDGLRGASFDVTARKEAEALAARLTAIIEATPDFVGMGDASGRPIYVNRGARAMLGPDLPDDYLPPDYKHVHPAWAAEIIIGQAIPAAIRDGIWQGEAAILRRDGSEIPVSQVLIAHIGSDGKPDFFSSIARDIGPLKEAEAANRALQEEMIRLQATAIAELSTPLIPIFDNVVVMPLIGALDSGRAQSVVEALLQGVIEHRARVVILDITGVPIVDTQVASALLQAAHSVRLLGAEVILTGIKPEVAQTLVGLGVNMDGVATQGTLQKGIAYAIQRAGVTARLGERR